MYDPQVGRFLSEDPLAFEAGDMNLFRYVGNEPLLKTDPSGLRVVKGFGVSVTGTVSRTSYFYVDDAKWKGKTDAQVLASVAPVVPPAIQGWVPSVLSKSEEKLIERIGDEHVAVTILDVATNTPVPKGINTCERWEIDFRLALGARFKAQGLKAGIKYYIVLWDVTGFRGVLSPRHVSVRIVGKHGEIILDNGAITGNKHFSFPDDLGVIPDYLHFDDDSRIGGI